MLQQLHFPNSVTFPYMLTIAVMVISLQLVILCSTVVADSEITFTKKWGSTCLLDSSLSCGQDQQSGGSTGDGQFWGLWGIASDESSVYALDVLNNRVQKFDMDGDFIKNWGSKGSTEGQFDSPSGIAVDSQYVYVVDHGDRIQVFNKEGDFIKTLGTTGTAPGQFNDPEDIDVDVDGRIYIADSGNHRIQVFNPDNTISILWGSQGAANDQFDYPQGISVPEPGHIYVADSHNDRIQYFEIANTCQAGATKVATNVCFVKGWGAKGTADGEFQRPADIDTTGQIVYVVDGNNNRVQLFTNDGTFISKFGSECLIKTGMTPSEGCKDPDSDSPLETGDGQFKYPAGITALSDSVFVADNFNDRIQKFSTNLETLPLPGSPVANAGQDKSVIFGDKVTLDGGASMPDDGSLHFTWQQISGGPDINLNNPNSVKTTFDVPQVAQDTNVKFELKVTDNNNRFDTDVISINIAGKNENQNPVANAGTDKTVTEGGSITLDGTASNDNDGSIQSYQWEVNGCSNNQPEGTIQNSQNSKATFVAPEISSSSTSCSVQLKVTDSDDSVDTDTVQITVKQKLTKSGTFTVQPNFN